MPPYSPAQAARLLEELRESYQSLAPDWRSLIRQRLAKVARVHFDAEKNWEK